MTAPGTDGLKPVAVNDYGKMALLGLSMVCATALACFGKVSGEAAVGVVLVVVGYLTGNGVLARRRQAPSTVLAPRLHEAAGGEAEA